MMKISCKFNILDFRPKNVDIDLQTMINLHYFLEGSLLVDILAYKVY